jgi:hypothetical protein
MGQPRQMSLSFCEGCTWVNDAVSLLYVAIKAWGHLPTISRKIGNGPDEKLRPYSSMSSGIQKTVAFVSGNFVSAENQSSIRFH